MISKPWNVQNPNEWPHDLPIPLSDAVWCSRVGFSNDAVLWPQGPTKPPAHSGTRSCSLKLEVRMQLLHVTSIMSFASKTGRIIIQPVAMYCCLNEKLSLPQAKEPCPGRMRFALCPGASVIWHALSTSITWHIAARYVGRHAAWYNLTDQTGESNPESGIRCYSCHLLISFLNRPVSFEMAAAQISYGKAYSNLQ